MHLPTVSFADWTSDDPSRRARFVRNLGTGLEELGFVCVEDPGIDPELLQSAYAIAARMFALPLADRLACEQRGSGRQRGYTPFGTEHAKDRTTADLKEFWQVGRNLDPEHPMVISGDIPPNAWPTPLPEAATTFDSLFDALEGFSDAILDAVGRYLGLDDGLFARMTSEGSSVLRVIHYPPVPADPDGAVRAAAHEDINLMTVLPVSTAAGLELYTREGEWVAVETPPGSVIVDTGDMMALLTGERLPATTHRVVNPSDPALARQARYSMPFFVHPHPEWVMRPFDGTPSTLTARDFLMDRLRAIGVAS
ncbi:MAG: isopenicillin N synthase family oxygenase [Alphaproteobacteria bacterium]|nr:isopenicillin N synthase family oxygenase [Alphaproteobacteria bacterium]MCB9690841.1 isopenicillin N synthase family oxygenase [Alphaproteobacteria bacterium]